jgi:hypothetical protein
MMVVDPALRIRLLAQSFPGLWNAPGVLPWNAQALDEWAASGKPSHGERCAAQLVLAVWNPDERWKSGRFDVMDALSVWDRPHRKAFLTWAAAPWWA